MNRLARSHRSTKIPNVKLRPAARTSDTANESVQQRNKRTKYQASVQDNREDDDHFRKLRETGIEQGAHVDADFLGSSSRPLKGAVLSITGLADQRVALTQFAKEMGARVEGNLTEDVTHLIADRPGSEKHRFALDLGMHIIRPEWITHLRQSWLEGEDVDAESLQDEYQLEALRNTTLCFAALTPAQRLTLVPLAEGLGATISHELRFDGSITHLVSGTDKPEESTSIHYLLHFRERAKHGRSGTRELAAEDMAVVRPEWLHDCHKARGCLREQLYSVFSPLPKSDARDQLIQKALAKIPSPFTRPKVPAIVLQSPFTTSMRSVQAGPSRTSSHQGLTDRHDADDQDELITLGTRQTADKSFDSILAQLKSRSNTDSATPSRPPTNSANILGGQRNGLLGMSRASSFSPAPPPPPPTLSNSAPRRKDSTHHLFLPTERMSSTPVQGKCFHGRSFKISFSDARRSEVLRDVLQKNGASVLDLEDSTTPQYCLVDNITSAGRDGEATAVTHFWVEYCLFHERFVAPTAYFAAIPAGVAMPLADSSELKVALLGFEQDTPEAYHARKLVEEIGGQVIDSLSKDAVTHLVCASKESCDSRRAQRARASGVTVTGLEFFIAARQSGQLLPGPLKPQTVEASQSISVQHESPSTESMLPLAGCIISRTKALSGMNATLERKALQLGAAYQAAPGLATTHLMHSGSTLPREAKELRRGQFLVHPCWLDKCHDAKLRVDESLFPSSLDPTRSLATVLSNSDGTNAGNFLSQASQSSQLPVSRSTPMQGAIVAAAKPWHRSVSTSSTSLHRNSNSSLPTMDDSMDASRRQRSESLEIAAEDVTIDTTLQGTDEPSDDEQIPAASSQTLFEQEDADTEQQRKSVSPVDKKVTQEQEEKERSQLASADEVINLLRSRALAQGSKKKKTRLPPRFRKEGRDAARSSNSPAPTFGDMPLEEVLELQARKDAERAEEAAAHGFSLGLESFSTNSQSGNNHDASIRIVYDDPAARRERTKLIKMLAKNSEQSDNPPSPATTAASTENSPALPQEERNEDGFGAGRRNRRAWHMRQSESPTKRPVVRRQPLARH